MIFKLMCYTFYSFGLFEAMSAIEIMDPKMDAGMRCNRTRTVHQMDSAIEVSVKFYQLAI